MLKNIENKAYELNLDKIDEGYLLSPIVVYATTLNKAKVKILHEIRHEDLLLRCSITGYGDEITYLNIPVIRCKDKDKTLFEGEYLTNNQIARIKRKKGLLEMLENPLITHCYIKKRGTYYRPNNCGYTDIISEAGVYTTREAVDSGLSCEELSVIPINIEEHNAMINDRIENLKTRII